jgi:hypothetical protein
MLQARVKPPYPTVAVCRTMYPREICPPHFWCREACLPLVLVLVLVHCSGRACFRLKYSNMAPTTGRSDGRVRSRPIFLRHSKIVCLWVIAISELNRLYTRSDNL